MAHCPERHDPGEGAVTNREPRSVGTPEVKMSNEMKGVRARVHAPNLRVLVNDSLESHARGS
jgi:hypothetical protein